MEKQQKKRIRQIISWVLIALLVALLAFMPLLAADGETTDGPQASILSGRAAPRDIATQIIGGGKLTSQDAQEITIPQAVKLTGYLVKNGDAVEKGQVIANVDRVTVMTAITQVQETLEHLAKEIEAVRDEEASDTVTAQAGGTVKIVYAQEGENVQDVMLRDGALAVLSLDGLMAVQIEAETTLSGGDSVRVILSDGREAAGRVKSNLEGILTITVPDDGYAVGEAVTVSADGQQIGSGTLYIHSQWNAVAYTGTISRILVSQGESVNPGRTLFQLADTGRTASLYQLSSQHREYEEQMLTLFRMYQSETITAPCAGIVTGVDEKGAYMLAAEAGGFQLTLLANAPNGDDETGYVNYVGQVVSLSAEGMTLKINPQQLQITDYQDLSGIPMDPALMTQDVIYAAQAPCYELVNGEWLQIDPSSIAQGDILLLAGDGEGNFVWVVRVKAKAADPEPSDPTEPTNPETPTQPDEEQATEPSEPGTSVIPSWPQTGFPQGGGLYGGGAQEEEDTLYSLETVTVASVTPQEEMTVAITIDELDITKISLGQAATITVDALTGEQFAAAVTEIAGSGENSGGSSKFTVELTLPKQGDMLPGMSASVFITLDTAEDVLAVPVAALTERGTDTILYRSYDEETGALADPVTVTVGVSDGEYAQILSGIGEGEGYYYAYYDTLEISATPDFGNGGFGFSG